MHAVDELAMVGFWAHAKGRSYFTSVAAAWRHRRLACAWSEVTSSARRDEASAVEKVSSRCGSTPSSASVYVEACYSSAWRSVSQSVCLSLCLFVLRAASLHQDNYTVRHKPNYRTPSFKRHNLVKIRFIYVKISENIAEGMLSLKILKYFFHF